jgi:hypothetical protein
VITDNGADFNPKSAYNANNTQDIVVFYTANHNMLCVGSFGKGMCYANGGIVGANFVRPPVDWRTKTLI